MAINKAAILNQMDAALNHFRKVEQKYRETTEITLEVWIAAPADVGAETVAWLTHTIERFRPPGTIAYRDEAIARLLSSKERDSGHAMQGLAGLLSPLRADYAADRLQSFQELVHADLFADFMEQAEHLLEQKYLPAAAVTAGAVLEEHLRKLCDRHGVPTTTTDSSGRTRRKTTNPMSADLVKAGVYNNIQHQEVLAWAGTRNAAAHGEHEKYDEAQVRQMIAGIRSFLLRHPA